MHSKREYWVLIFSDQYIMFESISIMQRKDGNRDETERSNKYEC